MLRLAFALICALFIGMPASALALSTHDSAQTEAKKKVKKKVKKKTKSTTVRKGAVRKGAVAKKGAAPTTARRQNASIAYNRTNAVLRKAQKAAETGGEATEQLREAMVKQTAAKEALDAQNFKVAFDLTREARKIGRDVIKANKGKVAKADEDPKDEALPPVEEKPAAADKPVAQAALPVAAAGAAVAGAATVKGATEMGDNAKAQGAEAEAAAEAAEKAADNDDPVAAMAEAKKAVEAAEKAVPAAAEVIKMDLEDAPTE
ncbi:hypothetical protein KKF91_07255 [Myxococcota bacterium]|nr:hypothetical protein [Myxococcota bacterium]MBU1430350.1 hypothetical protein [Myxococcota bacterium]MBU1898188.1 hypothetical protein [Myxococcota bacterium]